MRKYIIVLIIFILFVAAFLFFKKTNVVEIPLIEQNLSSLPTKNPINIVFSTDKKYKDYLKTALKSSIINKDPNTFYNIHILCIDLPKKEQEKFKSFEEKNVKITIIPLKLRMLKEIVNYKAKYDYRVSKTDLFKFFIPEMFKDYDKILYLDCDTLILGDLSPLYNLNLQDKMIGILYEKMDFKNEENSKFNCGVILFNIKECLKNNLTQKLVQAKKNDTTKRYVTQLAYTQTLDMKDIYLLPRSYNYLLQVEDELMEKPLVVHFAGIQKPWHNPYIEFGELWVEYTKLVNPKWNVEKRSVCFCAKNALVTVVKKDKMNNFKYLKKLKDRYKDCSDIEHYNLNKKKNISTSQNKALEPDKDKIINIVFTTDKKYKDYLKVVIKSLTVNKNIDSFYNIHIICVGLNKKEIDKFKLFETDKVKIDTIDLKLNKINSLIKHETFFHHVSKADYFKFFFPEIFKNLDKILYLDCDTLVLGDLSDLYNTDISDKYVALTRRFNYDVDLKEIRYNIGVILFNLDRARKDNITSKLIETKNTFKDNNSITQATFNRVMTPDMVVPLSLIYNNRTIISQEVFEKFNYKKNYAPFLNDINNLEELDKKTVIVHFAGYSKPWYNPKMKFASQWWGYAHLINPDWKVEKRDFFENLINSYKVAKNNKSNNTLLKFLKSFYKTFAKKDL